jgi:hypothetical protein
MPLYLIFGNLIGRIADFFEAHWRVIVPVLIVAFTYWHIQRLNSEIAHWKGLYTAEVTAKNNLIADYKDKAAKQSAKEQADLEQGQRVIKNIADATNRQMETEKNEAEKKYNRTFANINDYNQWLRDELRNSLDREKAASEPTAGASESGRDANTDSTRAEEIIADYEILKKASSSTTIYYNSCKARLDYVCNKYTCDESKPLDDAILQ